MSFTLNNIKYLTTKEFLEKFPPGLVSKQTAMRVARTGKVEAIKVGNVWLIKDGEESKMITHN